MMMKAHGTHLVAWLLGLTLFHGNVFAFAKVQPTALEWAALPDICKNKDFADFIPPKGQSYSSLTEQQRDLKWAVGGWHYCTGLVHLSRAELWTDRGARRERRIADAETNINYSFSKIDKRLPWAAEMAVAMARVKRLEHKPDEALAILDATRKLHPAYAPLYLAYAVILFDKKDYEKAAEILAEGNKATGDKIGELQYFLGIALFRSGDIDGAREFEAKAKQAKYPLHRLSQLLAEHDKKQVKNVAK
jgi:tetratricopeptide (TPR) repeat protein